jgi:hypothetical protein
MCALPELLSQVNAESGASAVACNLAPCQGQEGGTPQGAVALDSVANMYLPTMLRDYCPTRFEDDFSQHLGWAEGANEIVRASVEAGEYRVSSKLPYLFMFRSPACARLSYSIEADMRWHDTPGSDLGLLVGVAPEFSQYYLIDINTDYRAFLIVRRNQWGQFRTVAAPTSSEAIRAGTQVNTLNVRFTVNELTLIINGVTVDSWLIDTVLNVSFTGLAMAPYQGMPSGEARFDNFRVTTEESTASWAAAEPPSDPSRLQRPEWEPRLNELVPAFATPP